MEYVIGEKDLREILTIVAGVACPDDIGVYPDLPPCEKILPTGKRYVPAEECLKCWLETLSAKSIILPSA